MSIKDFVIKNYPLTEKENCELECYNLAKRRYLIFWEDLIKKSDIYSILESVEQKTQNFDLSGYKTLVVFGKTNESFKTNELFYFNGVNVFVVFYLINEQTNEKYMNDKWIYVFGCNYKKYVRRIDEIVTEHFGLKETYEKQENI